jgi:Rps23 Pro-64 3,4-dihydroxylase Tpa1-like proline 4-hydroxylase
MLRPPMATTEQDWVAASLDAFHPRVERLAAQWSDPKKPFRYLVEDSFLPAGFAEELLASYPAPEADGWDNITYTHQRKKFVRTSSFPGAVAQFFRLCEDQRFLDIIEKVTGIKKVLADPALVGGGLHQIVNGGFLNVHVDFNFHPKTKLHRRLNLLLYMNKDWRSDYGGNLELWDMQKKLQIENIAPEFNRAVLFETNEVSFHGHPRPLAGPDGLTRKSLAVYYYTEQRERTAVAPEHNTLYRNTTGLRGYLKTARSSLEATVERLQREGIRPVTKIVVDRLLGKPPQNE